MFESFRRRGTRQVPIFLALAALTAFVAHAGRPPSRDTSAQPVLVVPDGSARIEVAFVLDTTGSMSGLLEGAKAKVWSIANQLATGQPKPDVRIGLVGYRDRGGSFFISSPISVIPSFIPSVIAFIIPFIISSITPPITPDGDEPEGAPVAIPVMA